MTGNYFLRNKELFCHGDFVVCFKEERTIHSNFPEIGLQVQENFVAQNFTKVLGKRQSKSHITRQFVRVEKQQI